MEPTSTVNGCSKQSCLYIHWKKQYYLSVTYKIIRLGKNRMSLETFKFFNYVEDVSSPKGVLIWCESKQRLLLKCFKKHHHYYVFILFVPITSVVNLWWMSIVMLWVNRENGTPTVSVLAYFSCSRILFICSTFDMLKVKHACVMCLGDSHWSLSPHPFGCYTFSWHPFLCYL